MFTWATRLDHALLRGLRWRSSAFGSTGSSAPRADGFDRGHTWTPTRRHLEWVAGLLPDWRRPGDLKTARRPRARLTRSCIGPRGSIRCPITHRTQPEALPALIGERGPQVIKTVVEAAPAGRVFSD